MTLQERRRALMEVGGASPQYDTGYTEIGNPVISDNILTAGSSGSVRTNKVFSPGSSPWKIRTKFTWPGLGTSYKDIFGSCNESGTSQRGVLLEMSGANASIYLSSNSTSWDIASSKRTFICPQNTAILYEIEFTGTGYNARYSTNNGTSWTNITTGAITSVANISNGFYVGFGISRNGFFNGTIDLTETMIWIDDTLWWKAVA